MAVMWFDSFNYPNSRASAALGTKWIVETAYSGEVIIGNGNYGRLARMIGAGSFTNTIMRREFQPVGGLSFGLNFQVNAVAGAQGIPFLALYRRNGAAMNYNTMGAITFHLLANGMMDVRLQAGTRSTPTGTKLGEFGPISINTDYFLTIQYVAHPTNGRVKVLMDNKVVLNVWGIPTQQGAFDLVDGLCINTDWVAADRYIGNAWMDSDPNISVHRRATIYTPNENLSNAGFAPSTGTSLAACVDEVPLDVNDYISASLVGDKAALGFQDPVGLTDIVAVSLNTWVSKTDAGVRALTVRLKSGAAAVSSDAVSIPSALSRIDTMSAADPSTGLPWTNTALAGVSWEGEVAA